MRPTCWRVYSLLAASLLLIIVKGFFSEANAGAMHIDFEYDSVGICQTATATLDDGSLIGRARLENLVKGQYYLVRETHYSPQTGRIIYEGLSKFAIGIGNKIGEQPIRGTKLIEIFSTWSSGGFRLY